MNHIRRVLTALAAFAGALVAFTAVAPAAFAYHLPPSGGGGATILATPSPPGWNKHPPLHAGAHTAVIGGMPGWQIFLIAAGAALAAAAVAVLLDRAWVARKVHTTT